MPDPRDKSKVAEPIDLGPGYRLAARGRQEAEDDRLALLEQFSTRPHVTGVNWSSLAGGALKSVRVVDRWQCG